MAAPAPELLFLSGPQQGQRAVVMKNVVVAGRSPTADIQLTEESASRRQLRLESTPDGWVLENLSAGGTRINGKKYKAGKKVLLSTGDVIGLAAVTDILFVDAGDDPDEALAGYHKAHPAGPPPAQEKPAPAPATPEVSSPAPPPVPPPLPAGAPGTVPLQGQTKLTDEEEAKRLARKAKLKKYGVLLGIYAVVMVGVIVFLATMRQAEPQTGARGIPERLTEKIPEILNEEVQAAQDFSLEAREALIKARAQYPDRHFRPGNLYIVVKHFKTYLANRRDAGFENPDDERMYRHAKEELIAEVQNKYNEAWNAEQAGNWTLAQRRFEELLRMVPDPDSPIWKNAVDHLDYIKRHIKQR